MTGISLFKAGNDFICLIDLLAIEATGDVDQRISCSGHRR